MIGKKTHPAIEAIAAVNVIVADDLHGNGIPSFDEAAAVCGHQRRDFGQI